MGPIWLTKGFLYADCIFRKRPAPRSSGFIEPCLPTKAAGAPAGPGWLHEINHDGFRMMIRRDASGRRVTIEEPGGQPILARGRRT